MSLAVALALVTVTVACGGDRSEDVSGQPTTPPTTGSVTAAGSFGTLEGVCGPADPATVEPASTDPAETQGIGDGSIALGTMADAGFEGRPGLNQEVFDAGQAFVSWCNDLGGINGRQIGYTEYDAAVTDYTPRMDEACRQEFAMVGSVAVTDSAWPDTGRACGLIAANAQATNAANVGLVDPGWVEENRSFQPLPGAVDRYRRGASRLLLEEQPEAAERGVIVYGDIEVSIRAKERLRQALEELGYNFVDELPVNLLGESNWSPFASAIQNDEATYVTYIGEGAGLALMQSALAEVGYQPDVFQVDANLYDPEYLEAAGSAADGTFVQIGTWPFEEADQQPATQQYLDLVEAVDGKVASFGVLAMSAWLLFATLARDCAIAGDLTRSCILDGASEVDGWTGGGLHAPADPGTNQPSSCVIVMQVQDGEFVRHLPATADDGEDGYDCDPANLATVTPE